MKKCFERFHGNQYAKAAIDMAWWDLKARLRKVPLADAVQMAVDEACSNIIEHAYEGKETGAIGCTCEITPDSLVVILNDHGRCFDPTHASEPDLSPKLGDRAQGGLGIYFIRKLMDRVEYKYSPDCGNTLKLVKRRETSS